VAKSLVDESIDQEQHRLAQELQVAGLLVRDRLASAAGLTALVTTLGAARRAGPGTT
jgi:hypothetical protein